MTGIALLAYHEVLTGQKTLAEVCGFQKRPTWDTASEIKHDNLPVNL